MICVICGAPGQLWRKRVDGLPKDCPACEACYKAVQGRTVGVSRRDDGSLSITDGRRSEGNVAGFTAIGETDPSRDGRFAESGEGRRVRPWDTSGQGRLPFRD